LEKIVDENKLVDEEALRDLEAKITRQAEAMPKDDITSGDLTRDDMIQRLAVLADRLAAVEDSMSEVALPESNAPEISSVTDATSETAQSDKAVPAVETDSDRLLSRVPSQPAQPISVLSQASLVAVSGLLADNMAGRPVKQWFDIFQALGKEGALNFDMEALSGVLAENPPSRADLPLWQIICKAKTWMKAC
jgi:ATP-dependent exoDNAse (exonuclease V) alpha subunit